jgi:hypothetical protein
MKKIVMIAVAFFGINVAANAQSAADIGAMVDQQSAQAITTLTSVGASLKAGSDAWACWEMSSANTSLTYITLMIFQAMQQGMIDAKQMPTVQKAMMGYQTAITQIQANGTNFCKTNNPIDSDRKTLMTSINTAGSALAGTTTSATWTNMSL